MEHFYWLKTESGNFRKKNEDSVESFQVNGTLFMILADGFGISDESENGIPAGFMVTTLMRKYIEKFYMFPGDASLRFMMSQAIYMANDIVRQYRLANPEIYKDYGCSITLAAITQDKQLYTAHAGITRLYLVRNREIFQGTEDDNEASELLKRGVITPEEYITHDGRNYVTKALGLSDDIDVEIKVTQLQVEDFILLLSDGVYRTLGQPRILALIYEAGELTKACDWLIEGSKELKTPDNISAILSYIL